MWLLFTRPGSVLIGQQEQINKDAAKLTFIRPRKTKRVIGRIFLKSLAVIMLMLKHNKPNLIDGFSFCF